MFAGTRYSNYYTSCTIQYLSLVMTLALPQMTVVLQCLEEVSKSCLQASAVVSSVCSVHARHLECCHNTRQSNFSLPVPLTVTQSFQHPTGIIILLYALLIMYCILGGLFLRVITLILIFLWIGQRTLVSANISHMHAL